MTLNDLNRVMAVILRYFTEPLKESSFRPYIISDDILGDTEKECANSTQLDSTAKIRLIV